VLAWKGRGLDVRGWRAVVVTPRGGEGGAEEGSHHVPGQASIHEARPLLGHESRRQRRCAFTSAARGPSRRVWFHFGTGCMAPTQLADYSDGSVAHPPYCR
jgi:hypothetical protein